MPGAGECAHLVDFAHAVAREILDVDGVFKLFVVVGDAAGALDQRAGFLVEQIVLVRNQGDNRRRGVVVDEVRRADRGRRDEFGLKRTNPNDGRFLDGQAIRREFLRLRAWGGAVRGVAQCRAGQHRVRHDDHAVRVEAARRVQHRRIHPSGIDGRVILLAARRVLEEAVGCAVIGCTVAHAAILLGIFQLLQLIAVRVRKIDAFAGRTERERRVELAALANVHLVVARAENGQVAVRFELRPLRELELHLVLFAVAQIPAADIDGGFARVVQLNPVVGMSILVCAVGGHDFADDDLRQCAGGQQKHQEQSGAEFFPHGNFLLPDFGSLEVVSCPSYHKGNALSIRLQLISPHPPALRTAPDAAIRPVDSRAAPDATAPRRRTARLSFPPLQ